VRLADIDSGSCAANMQAQATSTHGIRTTTRDVTCPPPGTPTQQHRTATPHLRQVETELVSEREQPPIAREGACLVRQQDVGEPVTCVGSAAAVASTKRQAAELRSAKQRRRARQVDAL
jgi:hypothetical protein